MEALWFNVRHCKFIDIGQLDKVAASCFRAHRPDRFEYHCEMRHEFLAERGVTRVSERGIALPPVERHSIRLDLNQSLTGLGNEPGARLIRLSSENDLPHLRCG